MNINNFKKKDEVNSLIQQVKNVQDEYKNIKDENQRKLAISLMLLLLFFCFYSLMFYLDKKFSHISHCCGEPTSSLGNTMTS